MRDRATSLAATLSALALLGLWAPRLAHANPWDVYGFGPRAIGMGGAYTALADDFTATYYNPAGLTEHRKVHFGIGLQTAISALNIERGLAVGDRPSAEPPVHTGLTVGAIFPLGGKIDYRIALGIGLYVPVSVLFTANSIDQQTPQWYIHQSLPEKLVIAPALAFRITDYLSVGVGLQILADLEGSGTFVADLVNRNLTRRDLLVDLTPKASLTAGIKLGPFKGFRFGVSYRGSISLKYKIPAILDLEDLGRLALDISGITAWSPNQLTLGMAYELPNKKLRFSFDLTWAKWSDAPDPSTRIDLNTSGDVIDRLGLGEALDFESPNLPLGAENTLSPHFGVEWSIDKDWTLRGGYFFKPTPLPRQNGFTNYLDNNTHGIAIGFGWTHPDFLEIHHNPVTLELTFLTLLLPNRAIRKLSPTDSIGDLQHGGAVFTVAISVRHDF